MNFDDLKYNISLVPKGKMVISHFPELKEYTTFADPKNDDLLRIAFLAADEGSPFLLKYKDDFEKRINAVFEYLEIKNDKLMKSILSLTNPIYSKMVNTILVMSDNLSYVMWSDQFTIFHTIGQALREPLTSKGNELVESLETKAKLQQQQVKIHEQLINLEKVVFPDASSRKIARKEIAKMIQPAEHYADDKAVI